ncbi:MAG TPA: adenosylmethionine--8-amino-7-oxononanoate transaminase [Candidatus Baltobacteraceae bacterium]|jgi:adenosylmethionine-8-amino-7-oxononanoate transaminase
MGHIWLPFTQMRGFDIGERTFVRGEGCTLVDAHGRRLFDAISSVWTTIHGHGHPHIVEAIAHQAAILDHATTLGAANLPAVALAEQLAKLSGFDRVFFSSDGASAVEVALKMALQYWQNIGKAHRRRFARLTNAYHGDTAGGMSVSDIALFKEHFAPVLFETLPYEGASDVLQRDDLAAVIIEPVVQAAAGMHIIPTHLYEPLRARRDRRPLLIVDEIATGFGRTGPMFASTDLALEPDIMCVGKGLTGGTLPLSATLTREHIYESFLGDFNEGRQFFHGHSYAGNPIACAAAIASLEVFERENTLEHALNLGSALDVVLRSLSNRRSVREIRRAGLMCAIELNPDALQIEHPKSVAWGVADAMYERGHFTRPLGNAIQLVPPLASRAEDLVGFVKALNEVLDAHEH